ncbi:ABC transporter ATP-binding protein [Naumannella halotolerans]|uniref:ABC transporter ATP-binding protein n=1 Tax=Naumannella halotolerans TaxID=993414 RepID=UPI00370D4923
MSTETAQDLHRGAPSGTPLLHADDLYAGYLPGINILQGCSLVLHPGELVGIIGPNGAGKSTLLKALFGLVNIREGSLTLKGEDITNKRADVLVRKGVGFVPQTNNVFPSLTIEENLQMGVFQTPKQFAKRVDAVFDMFPELGKRRRQRAGALSGGERQMVAMGRALMAEPSVLLLDEPSAGLSPVRQDEAFLRTRRINKAGVSVVIVEQNARRCLQICDRAYVLDQGRNAYSGPGRELMNDPKVIELYLGTLAADVEAEEAQATEVVGAVEAEETGTLGDLDAQRAVVDSSDEPVIIDDGDPIEPEHAVDDGETQPRDKG